MMGSYDVSKTILAVFIGYAVVHRAKNGLMA